MAVHLRDLVVERLKAETTPLFNRSLSSIGVTAAQLWRQDANRIVAHVVNLSANTLFIGPFGNVSSTRGIRLSASGGFATLIWDEDFDLLAYEWFVIADAAASNLLTIEWVTRPTLT